MNKLSIHSDVPFFWDAWDIFIHNFETVTELKAVSFGVTENTGTRVIVTFKY